MRELISVFVFTAALLTGIFSLPVATPTIYEKIYPNFSSDEANSLLGRHVINKYADGRLFGYGMKYSLNAEENFVAEKVQVGETGQIIALQEINHGFILFIKWDKQNQFGRDMFSYDGRFSSRVFLEFE